MQFRMTSAETGEHSEFPSTRGKGAPERERKELGEGDLACDIVRRHGIKAKLCGIRVFHESPQRFFGVGVGLSDDHPRRLMNLMVVPAGGSSDLLLAFDGHDLPCFPPSFAVSRLAIILNNAPRMGQVNVATHLGPYLVCGSIAKSILPDGASQPQPPKLAT
jgi:hypothetical protein